MLSNSFVVADTSNYAVATGEKDKTTILIYQFLNELYNPSSLSFFENCQMQKGARILELGCGIGLMSQALASAVGKEGFVLATDISEERLSVAKSLLPKEGTPNLEFRQLSALKIDELSEQFDIVYARFLLVQLPEPQKVIQKVKKILKPGGKFIIEDITGNHTFYSVPHTEGMSVLHRIDQLQFEGQQSDDRCFSTFPEILEREGFKIYSSQKAHPKLDTPRKRKSILFHLPSEMDALLGSGKITEKEYNEWLQKVVQLEQDPSVEIYFYELGQLCATF